MSEHYMDLTDMLEEHCSRFFRDEHHLWLLRQQYRQQGYLRVGDLVPESVKTLIREEVQSLLAQYAKRRHIRIQVTGNSPRFLSNVRQEDIAKFGTVIPAIYHSEHLMRLLSQIAEDEIIPCPWEFEKFIINRLTEPRDTHGWHWGDYPHSLIWIIQAAPIEAGGLLQCIPHTTWNKEKPRVNEYIANNAIRSYYHDTGDIYFLKSDTTLHRVTPLETESLRIIINMAYEVESQKNRVVTHETFAFRE